MQGRRRTAVFLAPLAAGLGAVLLCLSGWGDRAGLGLYDILLRLRPAPERPRELLLVELDEATGSREWDGLGIAEGIATMAELGARYAVFPAPGTLDAAPGAKDAPSVPDLAAAIDEEFSRIDENVAALFDAIKLGSVPPKESRASWRSSWTRSTPARPGSSTRRRERAMRIGPGSRQPSGSSTAPTSRSIRNPA